MDAVAKVKFVLLLRHPPEFDMSSYFLDILCATTPFPGMSWKWTPIESPVLVYCQDLWEHKYRWQYARICEHFLAPLYALIFCRTAPMLSQEAMETISAIGDWYINRDHTYIRIDGANKPPHLLPKYVPDRLAIREITYCAPRVQRFTEQRSEEAVSFLPSAAWHVYPKRLYGGQNRSRGNTRIKLRRREIQEA